MALRLCALRVLDHAAPRNNSKLGLIVDLVCHLEPDWAGVGHTGSSVAVGDSYLRRASAAHSVFSSRQAMVIGPTPPGTGVMAPAIRAASA